VALVRVVVDLEPLRLSCQEVRRSKTEHTTRSATHGFQQQYSSLAEISLRYPPGETTSKHNQTSGAQVAWRSLAKITVRS